MSLIHEVLFVVVLFFPYYFPWTLIIVVCDVGDDDEEYACKGCDYD